MCMVICCVFIMECVVEVYKKCYLEVVGKCVVIENGYDEEVFVGNMFLCMDVNVD